MMIVMLTLNTPVTGLSGMSFDCPELRALLSALAARIDAEQGKLDSQEIGNALYGECILPLHRPELMRTLNLRYA